MRFSGIMVGSDDPHALGAFYTSLLGEPGFHQDTWYGWETGGQLMIGGHSDVHGKNAQPQRLMLMLEVESVTDAFKKVVELGAKVIAAPYKPEPDQDFQLATFEDPDGNFVQIAEPWE